MATDTGTNARAVLDRGHLARYTLGDRELEREVLGLFADQSRLGLARLKEARNAEDWRFAAHSLKGSARAVGAWRLAKLAEACERYSSPDSRPEREHHISALERAIDDVIDAIAPVLRA